MPPRKKAIQKLEEIPEACQSCRFFLLDDPKSEVGYCRRNPPVSVVDDEGGGWTFPVVIEQEWCGEYQRKLNG